MAQDHSNTGFVRDIVSQPQPNLSLHHHHHHHHHTTPGSRPGTSGPLTSSPSSGSGSGFAKINPSVSASGGDRDLSSLLSATSYPIPERLAKRTVMENPQTFYGLIFAGNSNEQQQQQQKHDGGIIRDSSSETPEPTSSRSRKRQMSDSEPADPQAPSADDQPPKKRGRPRKSTGDAESPGERRRTQIRLAQRAYRSRQEATVSSLRSRVSELESVVEQISQTFLWFGNELMYTGVLAAYPDLDQKLQAATEKCLSLAKQAESSQDDNNNNISKSSPTTTAAAATKQEQPTDSTRIQKDDDPSANTTSNDVVTGARPHVSLDPNPNNSSSVSHWNNNNNTGLSSSPPDTDISGPTTTTTTNNDALSIIRRRRSSLKFEDLLNSVSDMDPTQRINMVFTEPSGATATAGGIPYSLPSLQQSNYPPLCPTALGPQRFDDYSFAHRIQRRALERGYMALKSPIIDPDRFRKAFGFIFKLLPRDRVMKFFEIRLREGIHALADWDVPYICLGGAGTHYPRPGCATQILYPVKLLPESAKDHLDPEDFECEWFDAYDVQGFLEEKGVILGGSSYSPEESKSQSASTSQSSDYMGCMGPDQGHYQQLVSKRRFIIVDEEYMIDKLLNRCICLCRGSGFRRHDVEQLFSQLARPVEY